MTEIRGTGTERDGERERKSRIGWTQRSGRRSEEEEPGQDRQESAEAAVVVRRCYCTIDHAAATITATTPTIPTFACALAAL